MELEQRTLINELNQGKELAEQLRSYLNPASSLETRQFLIEKILSSYDKALSMLNWDAFGFGVQVQPTILESRHSFPKDTSPRTDVSDQDQDQKTVFKKRKTQERFTEQVRVCLGTGVEGPLDDGYRWRKYGQKVILGANFPREYYRCTHRHSQGCLAMKQVQRSDEDPSIFEVTYRGRHTCVQASHFAISNQVHPQQQKQPHFEEKLKPSKEAFNMGEELQVKAKDLNTGEEIFPSFFFLDEFIEKENEGESTYFVGSISPAFISPATSESNYLSTSPCKVDSFGIGYDVQAPKSELTDIISAPTSVTNSPVDDLDISNFNFDINFPFDDNVLGY
ncbi:hypothetical protein GH714_038496 [Hevea brasiliensis]|uniref:WRKY domain-containing protein n=1 Tax=Hevea brasiliensis TaxID=3981 RepID=A0A6A6MSF5_HEVBR|nr:hypothetical protein GH714_038496 [Hevea brasiliensis]